MLVVIIVIVGRHVRLVISFLIRADSFHSCSLVGYLVDVLVVGVGVIVG